MTAANKNMTAVADVSITDTSTHTYRDDVWNGTTGIELEDLSGFINSQPDVIAFFVDNEEDQSVTVQLIGNVDSTGDHPDYDIGPPVSVASKSSGALYFFPKGTYAQDAWPTDFISLAFTFGTAPTSGSVSALMRIYHFRER